MVLLSSPPLRSAAHPFAAGSSSLSNVCFGKRGMTIMVIGDVDLCMQLLMTCWVHENQIGERLIAAIYYPYFMVEMPTGFTCDRLAALGHIPFWLNQSLTSLSYP